ncbi:MAG: OmpH family outer membrane protein [Bacteroidia bacterium]|nr:OmpH family outer membrane protein [Bacteroidia bacterium]
MKKIVVTLSLLFAFVFAVKAQKIGYVNTKDVLSKMNEYNSAQSEIDAVSKKWQAELEKLYQNIDNKYKEYQANEVIMPEDVRKDKQDEIYKLEKEAKEYREKKFGYSGELFQLQDAKVKPLQDRIIKAVETVAQKKRLDLIFDKAGGEVTWLYTNAIFDITADVQKEMGIDVGPDAGSGSDPASGGRK